MNDFSLLSYSIVEILLYVTGVFLTIHKSMYVPNFRDSANIKGKIEDYSEFLRHFPVQLTMNRISNHTG